MVSSFMSYKILVRKHLNYIIFAPIIVEGSKKSEPDSELPSFRFEILFVVCVGISVGVAVDDIAVSPWTTLCPSPPYTVPSKRLHCALQAISHYLFLISLPENYSKTFRNDASGKPFITAHIFKRHFKKN